MICGLFSQANLDTAKIIIIFPDIAFLLYSWMLYQYLDLRLKHGDTFFLFCNTIFSFSIVHPYKVRSCDTSIITQTAKY